MRFALLPLALAVTLAACGPLPAPIVRPTGSPSPLPTRTHRPRPTRTPRLARTPRPTKRPAKTPTANPQASPTLPFSILTPTLPFSTITPTPPFATTTPTLSAGTPVPPSPTPGELDCKLVWQSPANGATYDPAEKFAVGWNIRNIGTAMWEPGTFEFVYLEGARLYHGDRVPLPQSVAPGDEIVLSLPMKAPVTPNMYTTHWGIRQGDTYFCRLTLTIWVRG